MIGMERPPPLPPGPGHKVRTPLPLLPCPPPLSRPGEIRVLPFDNARSAARAKRPAPLPPLSHRTSREASLFFSSPSVVRLRGRGVGGHGLLVPRAHSFSSDEPRQRARSPARRPKEPCPSPFFVTHRSVVYAAYFFLSRRRRPSLVLSLPKPEQSSKTGRPLQCPFLPPLLFIK